MATSLSPLAESHTDIWDTHGCLWTSSVLTVLVLSIYSHSDWVSRSSSGSYPLLARAILSPSNIACRCKALRCILCKALGLLPNGRRVRNEHSSASGPRGVDESSPKDVHVDLLGLPKPQGRR